MTSLPLIRRTLTGWECLVIGSAQAGQPVYTPISWDHAAWLERQRAAERARRAYEQEQLQEAA